MKKLLIIAVSILLVACSGGAGGGGGEGAKIDLKTGGKDTSLEVRSSGVYKNVKTFTDKEKKVTTAASLYAFMANFEMDTTNMATMKKPLTAPDQVRLTLQLIGEEGTNQDSELKPGTYKADPVAKYMKVDTVSFSTFADGKEVNTSLETMSTGSKITGEVRVKSVTAGEIGGEIDVTDGDKSVKGTFTAKIGAKK
jgi:hypothetical protein